MPRQLRRPTKVQTPASWYSASSASHRPSGPSCPKGPRSMTPTSEVTNTSPPAGGHVSSHIGTWARDRRAHWSLVRLSQPTRDEAADDWHGIHHGLYLAPSQNAIIIGHGHVSEMTHCQSHLMSCHAIPSKPRQAREFIQFRCKIDALDITCMSSWRGCTSIQPECQDCCRQCSTPSKSGCIWPDGSWPCRWQDTPRLH